MKRVSLLLDRELLKKATKLLGTKTHSATVNIALAETIRVLKIRKKLF